MSGQGQAIAKAYVQILPTTQGIQSGIEEQLSGTQRQIQAAGGGMLDTLSAVKGALVGLPIAKLIKDSVSLGAEFDASMSNVYSLMSSANDGLGLTSEQMETLRARARELGATTQFSAKDAAEAMGYMALAGWDAEQVYNELPGVLNLAAAAGMGLGEASDIVTDYMSAFSRSGVTAAQMSDLLAYAQANSNTTVTGLAEAYRNCASTMNAGGQTIHTTTALLEAMANQGYKGMRAGTALTAMQRDLTSSMKRGNITINRHKIAVMDANGNYRNMIDILRDVDAATAGMGDAQKAAALASVFTADSIKGVNMILNEGVDTVAGYEAALYDSEGAAQTMAGVLNDNLKGDLKQLNSAFEEAKITISDVFTPAVRGIVGGLTSLIGKFNSLPEPIRNFAVKAGTLGVVLFALRPLFPMIAAAIKGINWPLLLVIAGFKLLYDHSERVRGAVAAVKDVIDTFVTALQNGDSPLEAFQAAFEKAFGAEAWENAKNAISGVWGFVVRLKNALQNGVSALGEFIGGLIDGKGLSGAWESMKETLAAFDWASLGTDIWNGITGALSSLGTFISGLFTSAYESVGGINWAEIGQAILDGALFYFSGQWLLPVFQTAAEAVKGLEWSELGQAIIDGVKAAFTAAGDFLLSPFRAALTGIKEISWGSVGTKVKNGATEGLNKDGSFLSGPFEKAKTAIEGITWPDIGAAFDTLAPFMDTTGGFLSAGFEAASTAISGIDWGSVGGVISSGLAGAIDTLAHIGTSVWNTITGWFSGGGEGSEESPEGTGREFMQGIETGMEGEEQMLSATATTVGESVLQDIRGKFSAIEGQAIGETFIGGINTAFIMADMTASSNALRDKITLAFTGEKPKSWGQDLAKKIASGMSAKANTIKSAGEKLAKAAKKPFSSQNWESVGKDAVNGIAKGIRDNAGAVSEAMKDVMDKAVAAAQTAAEIKSPSRVFAREVGRFIPLGIASGIEQEMGAPGRVLSALQKDMESGFSLRDMTAPGILSGAEARQGFTQNITLNSPKALSPWEVARQTRNATRRMALALR